MTGDMLCSALLDYDDVAQENAKLRAEISRLTSLLACVTAERDDIRERLGRLRQYLKVIADDASNIVTTADAAERSLG